MEADIESEIAKFGHANVLVALKPDASGAAGSNKQNSLGGKNSAFSEVQCHFLQPNHEQAIGLKLASAHSAEQKHRKTPFSDNIGLRYFPNLGLALGVVNEQGVKALTNLSCVAAVHAACELELIAPLSVKKPTTPPRGPTWGLKKLNVPMLWQRGYRGEGVVVGHLDTGVDASHPALQGAVANFAEFDMNGDQIPQAETHDSDEHGTHTAGIIVGRRVNRAEFGVAPEARIASALVIEGGHVVVRVLAGLEWLTSLEVNIINMSLGVLGYTPAFQELIDALRRKNILPVIAIGNDGPNTSRSPGNYTNVLSVGAWTPNDCVAEFSGSEQFPRTATPFVPYLVAPGVEVYSSIPGGKFTHLNGTSMAAPHIAGIAALLLQAAPKASVFDIENAILSSCSRLTPERGHRTSRGFPDAVKAYDVLAGQNKVLTEQQRTARLKALVTKRLPRSRKIV